MSESSRRIVSVLAPTIQAIRKIIERMELNDGPRSYELDEIKALLDEAEHQLQSLKH